MQELRVLALGESKHYPKIPGAMACLGKDVYTVDDNEFVLAGILFLPRL